MCPSWTQFVKNGVNSYMYACDYLENGVLNTLRGITFPAPAINIVSRKDVL